MTNKKADTNKKVAKKNTSANVKKQHTPDIFSLSEPTAKKAPVKKVVAKVAAKIPEKKVEAKPAKPSKPAKVAKKVEVKKVASKPAVKPTVKKVVAKPAVKKVVAKKVAKPAVAKSPAKSSEKKAVAAKKEVNKVVNSLFDVVANIFEDINDNMWSISKDVSEQRFSDLSSAFDKVEKVMEKSDSIIDEDNKNRKAIASSSDAISEKSQELNDEIITFCEQVFNNHMENANLLMACRNLEDLQNARQEMYERDIDKLFDRASKSADIWFGMLEDSYEPLQKRADEISEKIIFRIL